MTANVYFGHEHISPDDFTTVTVDDKQHWRLMSNLPGTSPTDQCGEDELLVPADEYNFTYVGRGCTSGHAYLYVLRKNTLPQPQGDCEQHEKPTDKKKSKQEEKEKYARGAASKQTKQ